MHKLIKTHKLTFIVASTVAIVALAATFAFAPSTDAAQLPVIKVIDSYLYPGGPWCGNQKYWCEGGVTTSSGFYSGPYRVTTYFGCGEEP
jgi:hypothetical protein